MTPETFAYYDDALKNCTGFMDLGEKVYCKMYAHHYTTYKEFQDYMTLNHRLHEIKVPLFGFGADDDVILSSITIPKE